MKASSEMLVFFYRAITAASGYFDRKREIISQVKQPLLKTTILNHHLQRRTGKLKPKCDRPDEEASIIVVLNRLRHFVYYSYLNYQNARPEIISLFHQSRHTHTHTQNVIITDELHTHVTQCIREHKVRPPRLQNFGQRATIPKEGLLSPQHMRVMPLGDNQLFITGIT